MELVYPPGMESMRELTGVHGRSGARERRCGGGEGPCSKPNQTKQPIFVDIFNITDIISMTLLHTRVLVVYTLDT